MPNQCWAITQDISEGAVKFGTIYNFHNNGKFEATNYYSAGMYSTETVGGNYTYNLVLNEINLTYTGVKPKRTTPIKNSTIKLNKVQNQYALSIKNEYVRDKVGYSYSCIEGFSCLR
ncbi:hypothetical protein GJU39_10545 [Pedobacter petrophilus]|uniref:Uncharacterized protein n=1 Tax=Pedobacter petrophilus TaxID=1908241 RepID=A0A7K0FZA5_9SPHI|nr:hypothetical protein [Pedobacter petrophilus]MRX76530.1 hypothetical protein [Pedobacter petrophilus]